MHVDDLRPWQQVAECIGVNGHVFAQGRLDLLWVRRSVAERRLDTGHRPPQIGGCGPHIVLPFAHQHHDLPDGEGRSA